MTDTSAVTTPATDSITIVLAVLFELDHDLVDR
jgi:hypothetical protein